MEPIQTRRNAIRNIRIAASQGEEISFSDNGKEMDDSRTENSKVFF